MATRIQAMGDTIKIDKAFVSGKDRIAVNVQVVFEGKIDTDAARQKVRAGDRQYDMEITKVSKLSNAITVHLHIFENNELIHSGIYDQHGKAVAGEGEAKLNVAIQMCAMVGAVIGVVAMLSLNAATGVVPGGAIGGAIGGGVGAAIGGGIGSRIFGRNQ